MHLRAIAEKKIDTRMHQGVSAVFTEEFALRPLTNASRAAAFRVGHSKKGYENHPPLGGAERRPFPPLGPVRFS
jgi:hypothetical protein